MVRLLFVLVLCTGCSSTSERVFIALDSDFADFLTWERVPIEAHELGAGHPDAASFGYLSARTRNKSYPVGTMIVKAFENDASPTTWDLFAMAKRGGNFNAEGARNWEFFRLRFTVSGVPIIVGRGIFATDPVGDSGVGYNVLGDAFKNLCNGCHGTAESAATDHVLTPALAPGS